MSQTRVTLELDEELAAGLETAARRSRISVEDFATKAVARAVADVQQWAEEDAAYAEYEKTGETLPIAAVEEWVRSWGTPNELPPPVPCKLFS
jgi:predicted transcriptional regulator